MKLGVSLPADDVEFLDDYAHEHEVGSRSAALHRAIDLLRASQLGEAYADAWRDWDESGDAEVWEPTVADGVGR